MTLSIPVTYFYLFNFKMSDYQENDYEIPVVFVQKQSLEIIHENENDFELTIL